jgi:hypothetical protein
MPLASKVLDLFQRFESRRVGQESKGGVTSQRNVATRSSTASAKESGVKVHIAAAAATQANRASKKRMVPSYLPKRILLRQPAEVPTAWLSAFLGLAQWRPAKLDLVGASREDAFGSWNNERARTTTTLVNGRFTVKSMIDSRHTESKIVRRGV